jgi:hypothetical protein
MTDPSTLHVESRALVSYGRERYEDSVVYHAATRYLAEIGSVPAGAWGTLPVSDQLRRDWATALENRLDEAIIARNELLRMSDALLQVVTDYEGTDLEIATSFDLENRDLRPYLPAAEGYTTGVRTRRGGNGILAEPADVYERYVPPPAVVIPQDNERLVATRHETLPSTRVAEEPLTVEPFSTKDFVKDILYRGYDGLTVSGGGRTVYYEHGEDDKLNEFVQQYGDKLLQLEALITELGTGQRLPLSDLILHAWRSSPKIVRNRADLIHSAANTYAELRTNMDAETQNLALYWQNTGADAFGQYAELTSTYLGKIEQQARWLAEEGKNAASLLEGLRNAYAATGFERIGTLIQAMTEYADKITSAFSACADPEKTFLAVVNNFVEALAKSETSHVEALARLIRIEEQARHERPDIGSRGHDVTPFPRPEVGANVWADHNGWTPAPHRPAN